MLPRLLITRYVAPLREGGSLPGLVEADDLGTYVVKLRGAGQGRKVLVAEVVVGELGRALGLRVPELRALDLDPLIARFEADEEVQDLLTASIGLNLGVDFLPGSFGYDAAAPVAPAEGARILWLDAFTANVDRTWRNPNLLRWHRQLWCIDHGSALWFHHDWTRTSPERFAAQPYDASEHVLRGCSTGLPTADEELTAAVTPALLERVLEQVPDDWLEPAPGAAEPSGVRRRYVQFLQARLAAGRAWLPR